VLRNAFLEEQLEILRRIAQRGKRLAENSKNARFLDLFIHLLDEIERTKSA
jgi:hypothetical protein